MYYTLTHTHTHTPLRSAIDSMAKEHQDHIREMGQATAHGTQPDGAELLEQQLAEKEEELANALEEAHDAQVSGCGQSGGSLRSIFINEYKMFNIPNSPHTHILSLSLFCLSLSHSL